MFDVITVGSATKDLFLKSPEFKIDGDTLSMVRGSKMTVSELYSSNGGGGTNSAVTFARQGLKTACIVALGNDLAGDEILAELKQEGVDTAHILRHSDQHTALSVIVIDEGGERTILSYKGEGQHLGMVKISPEVLDSKWLFLGSLGGNLDFFKSLVMTAKKKNMLIASNPGVLELQQSAPLRALFKDIDIVIMNREEATNLLEKEKTSEELIDMLDSECKNILIITDGQNGAYIKSKTHVYSVGIPDSPRVDATGAGDAFASGFVSEYSRSGDIEKAIRMATTNATSVVAQFGAKAGILRAGDIGLSEKVTIQKY